MRYERNWMLRGSFLKIRQMVRWPGLIN